jgi:hypothetical protein
MSKDPKDPKNENQRNRENEIDPIPVEEGIPPMTFEVVSEYVHVNTGHTYGEKVDDQQRSFVFIKDQDGRELIATLYDEITGELDFEPFFVLGRNIFDQANLSLQQIADEYNFLLSPGSLQGGMLWSGNLNPGLANGLQKAVDAASKVLYQYQIVSGLNRGFNGVNTWVANGCTIVPDISPAVKACCDAHDACYCAGGDADDRLACDRAFRDCIRAAGHPVIADIYYLGVRTFGRFFFNYAANVSDTVPVLPVPDPANPCTWEAKLINVAYGGDNIGNDWKYQLKVQDSPQVVIAEHTVNHGTNDSQNVVLASGTSTCGEPTSLAIFITAIEVDGVSNDTGSTTGTAKFVCDGSTTNTTIKVYVDEGFSTAIMTFTIQIKTTC